MVNKKNCNYIHDEIACLQISALDFLEKAQQCSDKVAILKDLALQLTCEEDLSPKAVKENEELAKEIIKEQIQ